MKNRMSYMTILVCIALASLEAEARTIDGTMNMDEIPVLSFSNAFMKASKELSSESKKFVCTCATSKKRKSGGGWGFFFSSKQAVPRYIVINEKGDVVHNDDNGTTGPDLKKQPSVSVRKAIDTAEQKKTYTAIGATWLLGKDVWQVRLLDAQRRPLSVVVDQAGTLVKNEEASQQKDSGANKDDSKPDNILVELRNKIEKELGKLDPKPTFEIPQSSKGRSLVVRYKTRQYVVHPKSKSGHISEQTEMREGPSHDGFLLRAHVQPFGEVNQACVPQTLRQTYWSLYLQVYEMKKDKKQIYFALSYNSRTDKESIKKLKEIAAKLGTPYSPGVAPSDA